MEIRITFGIQNIFTCLPLGLFLRPKALNKAIRVSCLFTSCVCLYVLYMCLPVWVCSRCLVCSLTKGTVQRKNPPPQAIGAPVSIILPWTCAPLSFLPLSSWLHILLSSSNRPSLRMMRGHALLWWQRSTAHNALCQGKIKTRGGGHPHQTWRALCALWQVEYQVLLPPQREYAKHGVEILINTDANTSLFTTKRAPARRMSRENEGNVGREGERVT